MGSPNSTTIHRSPDILRRAVATRLVPGGTTAWLGPAFVDWVDAATVDPLLAIASARAALTPEGLEPVELQALPRRAMAAAVVRTVPRRARRRTSDPVTRAAELLGIPAQPVKRGVTRTGTG